MQKAVACGKHNVVAWLLFNCDHDIFDMENLMNKACSFGWLNIVKWLFKKIDTSLFDMLMAMREACDKSHIDLITFFMENIKFSEDSLKSVMTHSCFKGNIDIVKLLLDKEKDGPYIYDMRLAMNDACSGGRLQIVQWLLNSFKHEKFDMVFVLKWAFTNEYLDLAKSIVQNVKTKNIDMKLTLKWAQELDYICFMNFLVMNVDITDTVNKLCTEGHSELIRWILKNTDGPLFDMKTAMNEASLNGHLDIVKTILGKCNTKELNLKQALENSLFNGHLIVFKWLLNNIERSEFNINSEVDAGLFGGRLDLINWLCCAVDSVQEAMDALCIEGDVYSLTWLLDNVNNNLFEMETVVNHSIIKGYFELFKSLMVNNKSPKIDTDDTFLRCFQQERKEFVKWIYRNNDIALCNLVNTLNKTCLKKNDNLIEWILMNTSHSMKEVMNNSCRYGLLRFATWMLENRHLSILDILEAFDIIYNISVNIYDKGDINDRSNNFEHLIKSILRKVENDLLDMKKVLNLACRYGSLQVVNLVLENTDHKNLGVKEAMNIVYNSWKYAKEDTEKDETDVDINDRGEIYERLMKFILAKVDHDFLDLNEVLNQACLSCSLNIVRLILENTDLQNLKVKGAMNISFNSWVKNEKVYIENKDSYIDTKDRTERYERLIKLILEKVNHDSLDLKEILNQACRYGLFDIVTSVLENTDHKKLDVREAMQAIDSSWMFNKDYERRDEGINDRKDTYVSLIKIILEKVNSDSLDLTLVLNQACRYGCLDIVKYVLENNDHKSLDIMEAVSIIYSSIMDDDNGISDQRKKYEPLIKLMLDKVNHDSLDFKVIVHKACRYCFAGVITFVLHNTDHKKLEIIEAVNILYSRIWNMEIINKACCCGCLGVVTFVLENIDLTLSDLMEAVTIVCNPPYLDNVNRDFIALEIMYKSCCYGYLEVVTFVLENTNHKKLDIMKAVNKVYSSIIDDHDSDNMMDQRQKYEPIIIQILEKVNHDSLDLKTVFKHAFCKRCLFVVRNLLENIDHDKLNVRDTMNTVFDLCSLTTLWRRWMRKDGRREIKEPLIKLILEKVNHDSLPLKEIMNYACCNGYLDVVTYLLETNDHVKLDVQRAMNAIFDPCSSSTFHMRMNNEREMNIPLIKLILERVNHDSLPLKEKMNYACCNGYLDVVTYLLETNDHGKLDIQGAMKTVFDPCSSSTFHMRMDDKRVMYIPLIKLIFERVNHDSLSLKEILKYACCYGYLDVVTWLLENGDDGKLDVKGAMKILFDPCSSYYMTIMDDNRGIKEPVIKLILERVNHDSLPLKEIMNYACCYGYLDVVTWLLENVDHKKLDIMEAVNGVYSSDSDVDYDDDYEKNKHRGKYEPLIIQILEKVNHDSLDLKQIFYGACVIRFLHVVTFLLDNTDRDKLDVKKATNTLLKTTSKRFFLYGNGGMAEPIINLILAKVNHNSLPLKEVMECACWIGYLDFVKYLLDNTDQKKLDIMESVNRVYDEVNDYYYCNNELYCIRKQYEPLIMQILEKWNHDLLDLKKIFYQVCRRGCLDAVKFMLEITDHKKLDIEEAVNKVVNQSIYEDSDDKSNEELIKLLLHKVKTDLLDMEVLLNVACRKEWLDIVRWLVENVAHSMFDTDTAINLLIFHDSEETREIFKFIVQNISQNLFNIGTVIEQASRLNQTEKVLWLLQNNYSSLFDIKYVMNEACRNSNLQIIKYIMKNMDKDCFDVRSAMNKACRSALGAVKLLLENIPHNKLNFESAMNNACRYDNVVVVQWFWNNLDRTLFNVKSAWNNACYNCNEELISFLLFNMDEHMLDKSKALSHACRNIREGNKIISLLFKQPNMNTPENCKLVLREACVHCNRHIVEWLLSNTDIQPLEYKETLIDTIKDTTNKSNDEKKSDHESLVWIMVTRPQIKQLDPNDLSDVIEAVSKIGQLDMVQWLLKNTERSMFNMRAIVNTACESGQWEIVDWLLQNIELTNIDVHTVMEESCSYGWLKIVKLLWSTFDIEKVDMRTSIDEACSYGRYEVVKFLLENVDSKLLDINLVFEKACGYGWKDIIHWLFDNIDNISIDLKSCMFEACAQGRLEIAELLFSKYSASYFDVNFLIGVSCKNSDNVGVLMFLIDNFDLTQAHKDIIIRNACKYSWTEIVKSLIEVCRHNKSLMEEAMTNACISGETEIVEIFLDKIDISFLGVNTNMNISCQKGWDEIVSLLLERVDHSLFDFTAAMNEACRCGEADVVELLIQKVNRENFNFDTAIVEACKSHLNENLVLILLQYINRSTSDIEAVSGKAYDYGWRRVSSRLKRMIYNDISK